MKQLIKSLFVVVAFFCATSAFAQQCILAPQVMGQPQRCWDGRPITGAVSAQPMVMTQPMMVQPRVVHQGGVVMGSSNQCANLANQVGRVVGAEHNNSPRGAERGGMIGMLFGNIFCQSSQPQQVLVPAQQVQTQQVATTQQAAVVIQQPDTVPAGTGNIRYQNPFTQEWFEGRVSSRAEADQWIDQNIRFCTYQQQSQGKQVSCGAVKKIS